jgi:uncharacterized protein YqiB (DUF1249 family)
MVSGDPWCATSWRASPGSFVALMTLYESNYVRLAALCGDLRLLPSRGEARLDDAVILTYEIVEQGPYTTQLCLRLELNTTAAAAPFPELQVRIYHDARVVEASNVRVQSATDARLPVLGEDLGPRWARNMLLNKWLEYCADRGCRFAPVAPIG